MRLNRRTGLVGGVLAAAMLALAPAAFAANVVKVDGLTAPAGDVAMTAAVMSPGINFVTNFGVPSRCTGSAVSGYVRRGATAASGTKIGAITSLTFSPCSATTLGWPWQVSKKAASAEWGIYVRVTPSSKTQNLISVELRDVSLYVRSTGSAPFYCEFQAHATAIPATFNQTTQQLSIDTGASYPLNLTAYDGTGVKGPGNVLPPGTGACVGQIETGDTMKMVGSFSISTPGVGGIHLN
jgi:hypothetical protein